MKHLFLFLLFLLPVLLSAQDPLPANPRKLRLGYQTDGEGIVLYGSGVPSYTPTRYRSAFHYMDTTNNIYYQYNRIEAKWDTILAGAGAVADGVSVDNSTWSKIGGTDVQRALTEIDGALEENAKEIDSLARRQATPDDFLGVVQVTTNDAKLESVEEKAVKVLRDGQYQVSNLLPSNANVDSIFVWPYTGGQTNNQNLLYKSTELTQVTIPGGPDTWNPNGIAQTQLSTVYPSITTPGKDISTLWVKNVSGTVDVRVTYDLVENVEIGDSVFFSIDLLVADSSSNNNISLSFFSPDFLPPVITLSSFSIDTTAKIWRRYTVGTVFQENFSATNKIQCLLRINGDINDSLYLARPQLSLSRADEYVATSTTRIGGLNERYVYLKPKNGILYFDDLEFYKPLTTTQALNAAIDYCNSTKLCSEIIMGPKSYYFNESIIGAEDVVVRGFRDYRGSVGTLLQDDREGVATKFIFSLNDTTESAVKFIFDDENRTFKRSGITDIVFETRSKVKTAIDAYNVNGCVFNNLQFLNNDGNIDTLIKITRKTGADGYWNELKNIYCYPGYQLDVGAFLALGTSDIIENINISNARLGLRINNAKITNALIQGCTTAVEIIGNAYLMGLYTEGSGIDTGSVVHLIGNEAQAHISNSTLQTSQDGADLFRLDGGTLLVENSRIRTVAPISIGDDFKGASFINVTSRRPLEPLFRGVIDKVNIQNNTVFQGLGVYQNTLNRQEMSKINAENVGVKSTTLVDTLFLSSSVWVNGDENRLEYSDSEYFFQFDTIVLSGPDTFIVKENNFPNRFGDSTATTIIPLGITSGTSSAWTGANIPVDYSGLQIGDDVIVSMDVYAHGQSALYELITIGPFDSNKGYIESGKWTRVETRYTLSEVPSSGSVRINGFDRIFTQADSISIDNIQLHKGYASKAFVRTNGSAHIDKDTSIVTLADKIHFISNQIKIDTLQVVTLRDVSGSSGVEGQIPIVNADSTWSWGLSPAFDGGELYVLPTDPDTLDFSAAGGLFDQIQDMTIGTLDNFTSSGDTLYYTGPITRPFTINFTATLEADTGSQELQMRITKNAASLDKCTVSKDYSTPGVEVQITGTCRIDLSTNDAIALEVSPTQNTSQLLVRRANINLH